MPMTPGTQAFADNLAGILAAYTAQTLDTLEWEPGRVIHIAPGAAVAHDDCCEGQLWTRLVTVEPSPGMKPITPNSCAIPHLIATVELGLVRCASTVDDQGIAPAPTTLEAEGLAGIADMAAMLQAIQCIGYTRSIIRYIPQGPQGGCVGGSWTFTVRLDNCVRCPD